jgi:hypothetical protein
MVPGMHQSLLDRVRLAYQPGHPKEALEFADKGLAADAAKLPSRERHELWVLKSHSLSALGQWEIALAALDSASQSSDIDAGGRARLSDAQGLPYGLVGALYRMLVTSPSGRASSTETRSANSCGISAVA